MATPMLAHNLTRIPVELVPSMTVPVSAWGTASKPLEHTPEVSWVYLTLDFEPTGNFVLVLGIPF